MGADLALILVAELAPKKVLKQNIEGLNWKTGTDLGLIGADLDLSRADLRLSRSEMIPK